MLIHPQLMFQPQYDQTNPQKQDHNNHNDHDIIVLGLIFADRSYEVVLVFIYAGPEDAVD